MNLLVFMREFNLILELLSLRSQPVSDLLFFQLYKMHNIFDKINMSILVLIQNR